MTNDFDRVLEFFGGPPGPETEKYLEQREKQRAAAERLDREVCGSFARVFSTEEGARVLDHLSQMLGARAYIPPEGEVDATRRLLEDGQRAAYWKIVALVERGQKQMKEA